MLNSLLPWEFSASWFLACLGAIALYLRGIRQRRRRGTPVGFWRPLAFLLGVAAIYTVTQTRYDYLAQYMFFTHRGQHLVLHHLAPFLIALAAPLPILTAGLPPFLTRMPAMNAVGRVLRPLYRTIQHPFVAPLLFVGLIYFWLTPAVHFDAMLSRPLYDLMNWSMAIEGLLFWWLILDPRPAGAGGLAYGKRIAILVAVMPPQIALGAYITFSDHVLYDVYAVCGRAWPLPPLTDQQLGGLLTWIPAAMMSVVGTLIVLRYLLHGQRSAAVSSPNNVDTDKAEAGNAAI
ncbi:cytochrome c oxidase assembly protein [Microbulbifer sp. SAOS-129_SWC]|uniref:cytochrome c oxidase assembly protein n=1 Tax=Microbulbifer sp. SAOS-129_SWC TaxID=3145235 RepID=UPI003216F4D5